MSEPLIEHLKRAEKQVIRWRSGYYELRRGDLAEWFNRQYEETLDLLRYHIQELGITPPPVRYRVWMEQDRWDLRLYLELMPSARGAEGWLRADEAPLAGRDKLLTAIPACPEHGACVPHALEWVERARKALELWERWWNESDGRPWESSECDSTGETYCFFCGEAEHREDCLYFEVQALLGKEGEATTE